MDEGYRCLCQNRYQDASVNKNHLALEAERLHHSQCKEQGQGKDSQYTLGLVANFEGYIGGDGPFELREKMHDYKKRT